MLPRIFNKLSLSSRAVISNTKKNFLLPREFHNSQSLRAAEPIFIQNENVSYAESMSFKLPEKIQLIYKNTAEDLKNSNMMISPSQGAFFTFLIQMLKAKRILELGTYTGYSAACFAEGLRRMGNTDGAKVISVEYGEKYHEMAYRNINNAGYLDLVELILGDGVMVLEALDNFEPFDFVFLDANKNGYIKHYDIILERNLLADNGIMVADNVLFYGQVHNVPKLKAKGKLNPLQQKQKKSAIDLYQFNDHVKNDPRTTQVLLPSFDGLMFIKKNI
ncbi:hypothetical protein Glove_174g130 [Diversispora epigaea]|uniref:Caffeoyl-CoA O-methyltransferase n=1 Tax=Diversispora epigaea TaxID=1348612 RepID=A0A397INU9_9GLOM|nr:hypothetical protein Glove_174g130 [Diversispora epigaea]